MKIIMEFQKKGAAVLLDIKFLDNKEQEINPRYIGKGVKYFLSESLKALQSYIASIEK